MHDPLPLTYRPRMRALLWFLFAIAASMVLASLASYPAYLALHPLMPEWRIDKIASRLFDLFMLIGVLSIMRRLDLGNRRAWGYGLPRARWLRQFGVGLGLGVATMLPITFVMIALGARVPVPELSSSLLWHALATGLLSGLSVAFGEESLFRGLVQGAVIRELRRPLVGIGIVAVLFAAMHFLADVRIENDAVTPQSGLVLLETIADNWLSPAAIFDGFCALLVVGLLTGVVTWWTGAIAFSVGLHAGWVWMMRITLMTTRIDEHAEWAWLIYRPHGYVGWLTFAWTLVLLGLLVSNRRRFLGWRDPGAFRR